MSLHDSIGLVSPEHRNSYRLRGFTMIELLMVVLIVGILAAAGAPRFTEAMNATYARAAAARVQSDLKYARQLARQTSTNQTVTFDVAANRYTFDTLDTLVGIIGAIGQNRHAGTYTVTLSSNEFNSEINTADFSGTTSVTFDIHGHANSAGTVVVQSGNRTETVVVNAYGQVSIL